VDSAATGAGAAPQDALDLKGKMERFGDIIGKSLDLAEVGMNLSLSLISTFGNVAQQKIQQRLSEPFPDPHPGPQPQPAPPATPPAFALTNRLRAEPGAAVSISFSVNNESATEPKPVALLVEGFAGDRSGRSMPAETLRVSPSSHVIKAMDFDKFSLDGTIPGDAVPDTYRGAVVVVSDETIRFPILLVVDAATAGG
jgi:hypothetical protein